MSKILSKYENNLDKAWYNSSNIIYSECDDKDNELKTVRLTFKDGRTYEYKDVKVNDYLMLREATSQGKAFFKYLKSYEYSRVEDKKIENIQKELHDIQYPPKEEPFIITLSENKLEIINNEEADAKTYAYDLDDKTSDIFAQVFSILNVKFNLKINKENDN